MYTWSTLSESFYHSLLESQLNNRSHKTNDVFSLNNVVDTSCSNISSFRNLPKPASFYKDYHFFITDVFENINHISDFKIPTPAVIHKSPGNQTSRKINNLLYSSGNLMNSIYKIPYESSQFTSSNVSQYAYKSISKTNIFTELQREIINCTDSVYLYDKDRPRDLKHVVIKPSGVLNAGIMGLDINAKTTDDEVMLSTNELFTVYPSCFFYYDEKSSNYFMDPYVNTGKIHRVVCSWDGYSFRSKLYGNSSKLVSVHEDLDILELKAQNLSTYSTTVYARNPLGVFIFRYYFDEEWKIKPLNNVSFTDNEKIYYMSLSPYITDDAVFLKTTNELLVYDGTRGHEIDTVSLPSLINTSDDIIQTVSYGMDNNSLILGGNKLYHYDRRSNDLTDLILPLKSSISVTRVKWTERKYDLDYPSHHFKHLINGRNCSYSSYFRKSTPSFWGSFTACDVHPVYNYIFAVVCGTSDCILLFDLRIPNAPLLDIPLPCTKFIGSRFRSLKWYYIDGVSYLFAFTWRNKYPVVSRFVIDSSFYTFSSVDTAGYSIKDFENYDSSFDTRILFDRSTLINFSNTDQSQEDYNFPSYGTTIKSDDYFDLPLQFTNENSLTNIFHGYLGLSPIYLHNQNIILAFVYTTSGRLICLDMDNRDVVLDKDNKGRSDKEKENNENKHENEDYQDNSQIDLEDETNSFGGFRITCNDISGVQVPDGMVFDKEFKYIDIKKDELKRQNFEFTSVDLSDNFIKFQEQHFGDEKMYSSISVNNLYLTEQNVKKFNSRELLKRILEFNKSNGEENINVISLSQFRKLYGNERLDLYNHWSPLDTKLDEYNDINDTNEPNKDMEVNKENYNKYEFNKHKDLCSCSTINELINQYRTLINENTKTNNDDLNIKNLNNELSIDLLEMLLPLSTRVRAKNNRISNNTNLDESLMFDKGFLETFGYMILDSLLSKNNKYNHMSNVDDATCGDHEPYKDTEDDKEKENNENKHENEDYQDNDHIPCIKHRNDCRINDLIYVEVEKEEDEEEFHPLVDEIMKSWVVERKS